MAGLTALAVKSAKPGRHADGRGLYLVVRDSGSRAWVLRTQVDGARRDIGLGAADRVSLAQARAKAAEARAKLRAGEALPIKRAKAAPQTRTFADASRACHATLKDGWRNEQHRQSWLRSLEIHVIPALGDVPIEAVSSQLVRDALAPIWLTMPETARRILQRIGTVLDYAHIAGWRAEEVSLRSVPKGLPKQPSIERHYAAMPYADVPDFVARVSALPPTAGRDALLFTILTAARSGETRFAVWPEFDLNAAVWRIPAERMKMRKPHVVPLSKLALSILRRRWLFRTTDTGWVFSSAGTRPLSDMTVTKTVRDLGHAEATVHGFRSSFTDWAAEQTSHPKEVVDKALAHQLADRVEAAYRRTDFFERRRGLMTDWADFLAGRAAPN